MTSVREWMDDGTKVLLAEVDALDEDAFGAATPLPGWTRAHLIAHVHYNAQALLRLLHWARTGERTPMYASAEQRNAEIESGAQLPPAELRAMVHSSAAALAGEIESMPGEAWSNEVVTAQGRSVPASDVVWMRTREVTVHAVDLGTGVTFADFPDDLNAALVTDVVARRSARGEAAALAAWITGRATDAPELDPWL